jgi:hypothetical protein
MVGVRGLMQRAHDLHADFCRSDSSFRRFDCRVRQSGHLVERSAAEFWAGIRTCNLRYLTPSLTRAGYAITARASQQTPGVATR